RRDQIFVVTPSFIPMCFNAPQNSAGGVDHLEEGCGDFDVEDKLSVSQLAQQGFSHVCDRFELREAEKSTRPFDGVNRSKHARQPVTVAWIFFKLDELAVQGVQVFVALYQKLSNDVVTHYARPLGLS